jgi:hypothetical protein
MRAITSLSLSLNQTAHSALQNWRLLREEQVLRKPRRTILKVCEGELEVEELIWFSMPGAVIVMAVITVWPSTVDSDSKVLLWVVLVPVIGFIIHQLYRLIFESTGGFARKSRKVLRYISTVLAPRENIAVPNLERAFLIWETTFYSGDFPAPFRDHNRGTWHYILSFWSISLSAILALLLCLIGYFVITPNVNILLVAIGELFISVLFYLKGRSSYQSLVKQEIAVVHNREELFLTTLKKLRDEQ